MGEFIRQDISKEVYWKLRTPGTAPAVLLYLDLRVVGYLSFSGPRVQTRG